MNIAMNKWEEYQAKLLTFDFTQVDTTEVDENSIEDIVHD